MFNKKYEERLAIWSEFRNSLETSETPYQDVIDFYKQTPLVSIHTDPWDRSTWPTAWELLHDNQYCEFCRVLGYYFSLQLTERFSNDIFEIHIITSKEKGYLYLLVVNQKWVLGYEEDKPTAYEFIAKKFKPQLVYNMSGQH
jgi:hypothetical protein